MTADYEYAKGLGASGEVLEWCQTVLLAYVKKNNPPVDEREHVIDYLMSDAAPKRLRRMSYAQAQSAAKAWSEASQKKGHALVDTDADIEHFMDLDDGTRIVKLLTKKAYEREGSLMRHCLGGYTPGSTTIYSLRDKENNPHVTFEIAKAGDAVQQVKGKGNGPIHPRYIDATLSFLKKIGVNVRPSEMENLGYYHVSAEARAVMARFVDSAGNGPAYSHIGGETYIFERRS
jgi:hypothetical protein